MALGFFDKEKAEALPHPAVPLWILLIVENAIRAAWSKLLLSPRPGFDISLADEDPVTHELYEALTDDVFDEGFVAGFDGELFETPVREPKVRSYNYSHLDKMPDMRIRLVRRRVYRRSQDGIFIECKPVDSAHSVGKHYCSKGIARFVRGDYAWTMTSALMIGYVKGNYSLVPKLPDALEARIEMLTLEMPRPCGNSKADETSEVTHISRHGRIFNYLETQQPAPAITIRHLWLRRD